MLGDHGFGRHIPKCSHCGKNEACVHHHDIDSSNFCYWCFMKANKTPDHFEFAREIYYSYIPSLPGVYWFYRLSHARFAYIGSSKNLGNRLRSHIEGKGHGVMGLQIVKHPEDFVVGFKVLDEDWFELEQLLIRYWRPMYNRMLGRYLPQVKI